ncbi:MAG: tetratricopeptide repeat protein [Bacteroidota bacterium]
MKGTGKIILIVFFVLLLVLLLIIPRTPSIENAEQANVELSESEKTIKTALTLVRSEAPMQGILMLRDLSEKEPDNIDAHWHLGELSVESGQFEKAIMRFEKVIVLDNSENPKYKKAYFYLGNLYANLSQNDKAIESFNQLLELEPSEEMKKETLGFLEQLNNN